MTNEEIFAEKEEIYKQINLAEDRLTKIRLICKHEKTTISNYMWRVGSIHLADVCVYCGTLVRYR